MKKVLHRAESRGHANYGWLDTRHTFSFANYYNPERMGFGALRVLNDDIVAPGRGFSTHPHDNMEIISIPLRGALEHKDDMGYRSVIRKGEIQVMSAGRGIFHSEYNKSHERDVNFLQIWVLPNQKNVEPRYDQMSMKKVERKNGIYQILSPDKDDDGVWIHQKAWFFMGDFEEGHREVYGLREARRNGLYLFVLDGAVDVEGVLLQKRDGLGLWETEELTITAKQASSVLLMEVPMNNG